LRRLKRILGHQARDVFHLVPRLPAQEAARFDGIASVRQDVERTIQRGAKLDMVVVGA
jgi:hypothetical protein